MRRRFAQSSTCGCIHAPLPRLLGVVLLACLSMGQRAEAQAQAAPSASGPAAGPMRFEMVPQESVRPLVAGVGGQSPFFHARFTNNSDQEVYIPWNDTLYDDMFKFTITGPDGKRLVGPDTRMTPPVLRGPREFVRVGPGETVTYSVVLGVPARNAQIWFFRKPGRYKVETEYVVATDLYVDVATGAAMRQQKAWRGSLKAEPITFDLGSDAAGEAGTTEFSGTVTDPEGKPIAGARVMVTHVKKPAEGVIVGGFKDGLIRNQIDRLLTDEAGRFTVKGLPTNAVQYDLEVTHPRYVQATLEVVNPATLPGALNVPVVMGRGIAVKGRVTDEAGVAIHGVYVRSYPGPRTAFTDAEGRFELVGVPPDRVSLDFWRPGYALKSSGPIPADQVLDVRGVMKRETVETSGRRGGGGGRGQ